MQEKKQEKKREQVADYLTSEQKLIASNCGRFDFPEVTEKDGREAIQKVDDKVSFGADSISYGCLKSYLT